MGWKSDVLALGLILLVGFVGSNIDQDRAECTDQVLGLATCLPYVGGQAKAPTPDCCGGLNMVLQKSKKCLCILIKDRDDPSLGLKINITLALGLPTACHTPANISECVDILHLPPNSREAKEFMGFDSSVRGGNATNSAPALSGKENSSQNSDQKSDGGISWQKKTGLGLEIMICFITSSLLLITHIG